MLEKFEKWSRECRAGAIIAIAGASSAATGEICEDSGAVTANQNLTHMNALWADRLEYGGFCGLTFGIALMLHSWHRHNE